MGSAFGSADIPAAILLFFLCQHTLPSHYPRSQVQVVVSGQESTKTLGPGAYFGELCLLDGQAPTATVVALGEVTSPLVTAPNGGRCSMWVEPGSDVITISLDKDGACTDLPVCQSVKPAGRPARSERTELTLRAPRSDCSLSCPRLQAHAR